MHIRRAKGEEVGINTTPFVDVLLVLLIFFMLATSFDKVNKLNISLPEASKQTEEQALASIIIGIDANGCYYLQGVELASGEPKVLKAALAPLMQQEGSTRSVVIMGDKRAPHQAVVTAMDVAGQLGATQLQVVAVRT